MRPLAVAAFLALVVPLASAQDKDKKSDEDKAKEVALAFLKAVKAKDVDALLKTVDVPFLMEGKEEPVAKAEDLKEGMKTFLAKVEQDRVPADVGKVMDVAGIRDLFAKKDDKKPLEAIEKVLGKTGYAVFLVRDGKERGAVLVRVKDGKAAVVGIPR